MTSSSSVRQRKPQSEERTKVQSNGSSNHRTFATKKTSLQTSFLCLIVCVFLFTLLFASYTDSFHPIVDKIAVSLGYKQLQYAVVIDAGSTGSRVLAYEFHIGYSDGRLILDSEIFEQSKPGLSSYHDKLAEGAETIELLLEKAKEVIPKDLWAETPLVLNATAGLQLLHPVETENLLNEVREVFLRSGFLVKDDAVEIMFDQYQQFDKITQSEERTDRLSNGTSNHRKSATKKTSLQTSFLCLIVCVLLFTFLFVFYTESFHPIVDKIAVSLGYKQLQYAVVIDAGSTGSRVLAYEFHVGYSDGRLILDNELFEQSKPGLSSYHDKPVEGAKTIQLLLEKAKAFIPKDLWEKTPLVLKATAGLRLLLPVEAENLLNEVREVFLRSGFLVKDDAVEIMDGIDEGIYSWFTVNFLLGRLGGKNTVAALDLGGGSTQVTFAMKDASKTPLLKDFMHTVSTPNAKIDVFTNSYLNLGLQAVRHAVFTHSSIEGNKDLDSVCVNPIIKSIPFKYGTKLYTLSGSGNSKSTEDNPVVDFEKCVKIIKDKTMHLVYPKPITLNQNQITAFSYFWERAIETGLVDPFEGGEILVGDFISKAKEVCATPNVDQPFMCMDMTYISILLKDGYGLDSKTKVKLYKKIDGHEISWALGCAYNLLADVSRSKK